MSPDAEGRIRPVAIVSEVPWHCVFRGRDCFGPLERHHLVSAQRIRRSLKTHHPELSTGEREDIVWDHRILAPVCRYHHAQISNARIYITREQLPKSVFEYAEEWGLGWCVDREYPEEEAA